ncbi:hypothetical protein COB55_04575 [Candidatus Wolfebacteria bacterium]|nr:MAG: hypothetical protein COB55_04575 [Candidatus Wolfebacteria bacterium]
MTLFRNTELTTNRILGEVLFLSGLLFILHSLASKFFWYWHYWWFDIVMHLLGGFILGLLFTWFIIRVGVSWRKRVWFYIVALIVLAITIWWEIFEYVNDMVREINYISDTTIDIMLGVLGASLAYMFIRKKMIDEE